MEEQGKKWLTIGLFVLSMLVAATVFYRTFFSSSTGGGGDRKVYLMCKSCGGFEISADEFRDMMNSQPGGMMPPMMGSPMLLTCPKCNQKSCMKASKCEKCETMFIPKMGMGQNPNTYPDKCPKCGYSAIEERQKAK